MSLPVGVRFSCEIRFRLIVVKNSPNQFDFAIKRTQACVLAFEIRLHIVLDEKWWNLIQEILFHLFKKYLFTCLLVDCPLEPIAQQHHPKQAPFQKRVFTLSMFSLLKIGCVVTTYLSFLQILGVFKQKRRISICQFVKPPRPPEKCQVFLLSHEAPRINTNFKLGNQNN